MERCKLLPSIGNSDHDTFRTPPYKYIVSRPKPPRRKIYWWKRADTNDIQEDLSKFAADFQDGSFDPVNSMWGTLKEQIRQTMDRRIPSKMTQLVILTHVVNDECFHF